MPLWGDRSGVEGEVVVVVARFNRARTPFAEQGGTVTCPRQHSPTVFLKKRGKHSHSTKKREKRPPTPTTFENLQPKRWHKLVQDVVHAARSARPQPPCAARWWGHQVLSAGRRPREAEGTLSPSRSLAASPSYEIFGWEPEGKRKMGSLSHGMFHLGARCARVLP